MTPPSKPSWLAEVQRAPAAIPARATRPAPMLIDAHHRPIATPEGWARRRDELAAAWRAFLGAIPAPRAVAAPVVLDEDRPEGVVRQLDPVRGRARACRSRATCSAPRGRRRAGRGPWSCIRRSITRSASRPGWRGRKTSGSACTWRVAAMSRSARAASSGSTAGPAATTRPSTWLRRRHPGRHGDGQDALRRRPRGRRAGEPARRRPPTASARSAIRSGAKEALYLAAFDERVRATVSSEGGIGLADSNWDAPWYLGEAIRRPGFALEQAQVLALAAPRAFLLIGGDSADGDASWPSIDAVLPGLVAARRGRRGRPVQPSPGARLPRDRPGPRLRMARLVPAGLTARPQSPSRSTSSSTSRLAAIPPMRFA